MLLRSFATTMYTSPHSKQVVKQLANSETRKCTDEVVRNM